jgi:hypothetical protein
MKQIKTNTRADMYALIEDVNSILIKEPQARVVSFVQKSDRWVVFIEYDVEENKDVP